MHQQHTHAWFLPSVPFPGVTEEAAGLEPHTRRDSPVRMRVNGGYTICRLDGARGNHDSKEALITMVLHVEDLGAVLSESHWLLGRHVHRTPMLAQVSGQGRQVQVFRD